MAFQKAANASKLFKAINFERVRKGFSKQKQLSEALNKQSPNLWDSLRKGSTKFDIVLEIAEKLDIEIVFRTKDGNATTEHVLTEPKN